MLQAIEIAKHPKPEKMSYSLIVPYRLQDSFISSSLRLFVGIMNYEFKFCGDHSFVLR